MKIFTAVPVAQVPENVDFSVTYIDNSHGGFDLGAKLNYAMESAEKAGADWLCMRHDDLEIQTPEAVEPQLEQAFRDGVRVAGVIGTTALQSSLQWWQPTRSIHGAGAIIQGFSKGQPDSVMADWPGYHPCLASADGCILWVHKDMFDFRCLEGFGRWFYDIQVCLEALRRGHKVATLDVRCRHQSEGGFDFQDYAEKRNRLYEFYIKQGVSFPVIGRY